MGKKRIALWCFVFGALGLVGSLLPISRAGPVVYLIWLLLMAPYIYIQYQEGYQSA